MTRYHAHRKSAFRDVLAVLGSGAVFLVAMTSWLVLLWLLAK